MTDDVEYVMETLEVSEEKAIQMIKSGLNVSIMRNGISVLSDEMENISKKYENISLEISKNAEIYVSGAENSLKEYSKPQQ